MDYTTLGRTGLRVSVMGLGCGGPSKVGMHTGRSRAESVRLIRGALDLGVNLVDTAEQYHTEDLVGEALRGVPRDSVVVCTKRSTWETGPAPSPEAFTKSLEDSLRRLRMDCVDVYHLHGVRPGIYTQARDALVPVMLKLRNQGKIRFLGITEAFELDPAHTMLREALHDDCWEVMMVGFNLLNQTARETVFPVTRAKNIGTVLMFAVRRALSRPARLLETLDDLVARGKIDAAELGERHRLDFLVDEGAAESVIDAAYRFCRHEPGVDVVLSGTGSTEHLRANARSLCRPDLPAAARERLMRLFAGVDDVVGD